MNNDATVQKITFALSDVFAVFFAIVGLVAGIIILAVSPDATMRFHGAIVFAGCSIFIGKLARNESDQHNSNAIKAAIIATLLWSVFGFGAGLFIELQLNIPDLNFDLPWTNYGRLLQLHTAIMIFALCGNALLASSFYVLQQSCGDLRGRHAPWFVFIGFNVFNVMLTSGVILGVTSGREYFEPEWYQVLWLALVWAVYLFMFIGTILHSKETRIHVANWFFLAFAVAVSMMLVVNIVYIIPVSPIETSSYAVSWPIQLYDYRRVDFSLTAGFLGVMYYFLPARTKQDIYSNKLALLHCFVLCVAYIWFGPNSMHFLAHPDWSQEAIKAISAWLWLLFLFGMINGLTPLIGAWNKLRTDPVTRFLVVGVVIKLTDTIWHRDDWLYSHVLNTGNSLSHYTDWSVGNYHISAGWGALMILGAVYSLVPWIWKRKGLYSKALVEWHFLLSMLGILLYSGAIWLSSIVQGLMWAAHDEFGGLKYTFVETLETLKPYYITRAVGGGLFALGILIMIFNIWLTVKVLPVMPEPPHSLRKKKIHGLQDLKRPREL